MTLVSSLKKKKKKKDFGYNLGPFYYQKVKRYIFQGNKN